MHTCYKLIQVYSFFFSFLALLYQLQQSLPYLLMSQFPHPYILREPFELWKMILLIWFSFLLTFSIFVSFSLFLTSRAFHDNLLCHRILPSKTIWLLQLILKYLHRLPHPIFSFFLLYPKHKLN